MRRGFSRLPLAFVLTIGCALAAAGLQAQTAPPAAGSPDKNSAHGGVFLRSADKRHAVEGVFVRGTFGLYVYNFDGSAPPSPLNPDELNQVKALVQWSDAANATRVPLVLADDTKELSGLVDSEVKLPATLTARVVFPRALPKARPETFSFMFSSYTQQVSIPEPPPAGPTDHSGATNAPAPLPTHSPDTLEHRPGR